MEIHVSAEASDGEEGFFVFEFFIVVVDVGLTNGEERFLTIRQFFSQNRVEEQEFVFLMFTDIDARECEEMVGGVLEVKRLEFLDELLLELLHISDLYLKRSNDRKMEIGIVLVLGIEARSKAFDVFSKTVFREKCETKEELRFHRNPRGKWVQT